MNLLKKLSNIRFLLQITEIFNQFIGLKKILFLIFINIVRGSIDGIGLILFIPLLSTESLLAGHKYDSNISNFFVSLFKTIGVQPSFNIVLILIICVFLIKGIIFLLQGFYEAYIYAILTKKAREFIVSSLIKVDYQYYIKRNTGYYTNLITTEIDRTRGAFGYFIKFISTLVNIILYSSLTFLINPLFAGMAVVLGLIASCALMFVTKLSRKYSHQLTIANQRLGASFIQIIQAFKYFFSTDSFNKYYPKVNNDIQEQVELQYKSAKLVSFMQAIVEPIVVICVSMILYFEIVLLKESLSLILVSILIFYRVMINIMNIQVSLQNVFLMAGSVNAVSQSLQEITMNQEKYGSKRIKEKIKAIKFNNVSFSYGNKIILNDINIEIPANKTISIVGTSGAGKSTLVDLVTGMLKPTTGMININDMDYSDIEYSDLRNRIGYVTQDCIVFDDTIANNISLWTCNEADNDSYKKISDAARIAYCEDFILARPDGYNSIIGDRGVTLSGGQKQRLVIAREIFKQPDILILDEATSSLDSESERYIKKSIDSLKGKLTIIIIAHRLSTVRESDIIFVLEDGRITVQGNFEELLNMNVNFQRMCEIQQL